MLHMFCSSSVFFLCDPCALYLYSLCRVILHTIKAKCTVMQESCNLGPSLKTALKPNRDVLNELHYFIARCSGEPHTNMLDLPSEHSFPQESQTPPCLTWHKAPLLEGWTNPSPSPALCCYSWYLQPLTKYTANKEVFFNLSKTMIYT